MSSIWSRTRWLAPLSRSEACQSPLWTRKQHLRSLPVRRSIGKHAQFREYAATPRQKLDTARLRHDVDERARLGFYNLSKRQGALPQERDVANAIFKEFAAKQKTIDVKKMIKSLSSKYKISFHDISGIAIVTMKIPDLSDPVKRAQLPPSQHKPIAAAMLVGCAQLQDPLAIMQIMTAVYLAELTDEQSYKDIVSLFTRSDIAECRNTLSTLDKKPDTSLLLAEILTLQGLFFERAGKKQKARECYMEAVKPGDFSYKPQNRHPMQLPLPKAWNALGYLLMADEDPLLRAEAKTCFESGALKADDPLSYYELAQFEDRTDPKWLQYTSKAAASGHRQATVDLAEFYQEASSEDRALLSNSGMRKALSWLLDWKRGSTALMAREWLQAASIIGHKPSTMQLADYYEEKGDEEGAKECWRRAIEPVKSGEEWPQIVKLAKKRLAGIKSRT